MEKQVVIETRNVRKTFPGVVALDGINLRFKAGEVHAIIGENGAGKSTLMNILSGVYAPDSGSEVRYKGSRVEFRSTADAAKCQIAMIHQENSLVKHLTVYENIYLGHFIKKGAFIDKRAMRESAAELLKKMHIDWIKPGTLVTKSSLPAKAGGQVVTSAVLTMDGDVVTLNLKGTSAMRGKTFMLVEPDRVVLDIEGDWKVEAPRVPSNRMVRALRVGSQDTATRLVFDMRVKPVKVKVTNPDADSLELTIR